MDKNFLLFVVSIRNVQLDVKNISGTEWHQIKCYRRTIRKSKKCSRFLSWALIPTMVVSFSTMISCITLRIENR